MPITTINATTPPINFTFRDNDVRVIQQSNGSIWLSAKDTCAILGTKTTNLRALLDEDEIVYVKGINNPQKGGKAPAFVSEAGFYKLVLRSRKPIAKEFQRWVTHDVLPSIRQNGVYMTLEAAERALYNPDFIIGLANQLKAAQTAQLEAESRASQAEARIAQLEPDAEIGVAFQAAPEEMLVRDASKYLMTAGVEIRERDLFAWMVANRWLYRKSKGYRPYAEHVQAHHLVLVPARMLSKPDGSQFMPEPTVKVTRKGLTLLFRRLSEQRALMIA